MPISRYKFKVHVFEKGKWKPYFGSDNIKQALAVYYSLKRKHRRVKKNWGK